jgi:SAM-dependent methyltransferase
MAEPLTAAATYWANHYNESAKRFRNSPMKQVGKTVAGREVDRFHVDLIIEHITHVLSIAKTDRVLDLCCGNGLLTERIAADCRVTGVDFSHEMIACAQTERSAPNAQYVSGNVVALTDDLICGASKIYMWEGLQYLSGAELRALLTQMRKSPRNPLFLIGGIPDIEKLEGFYDTPGKLRFFHDTESRGEPHMGKWWSKCELAGIAAMAGIKVHFLAQPEALYTASYRFDCVMQMQC